MYIYRERERETERCMNNTYISIHVFVHMQSYGEKEREEGGIAE